MLLNSAIGSALRAITAVLATGSGGGVAIPLGVAAAAVVVTIAPVATVCVGAAVTAGVEVADAAVGVPGASMAVGVGVVAPEPDAQPMSSAVIAATSIPVSRGVRVLPRGCMPRS